MSSLTLGLLVGAIVLIALLILNAFAYRARHGIFLIRKHRTNFLTDKLSKADVLVGGMVVLGLAIGHFAPSLAPTSALARWLEEPYAKLVYYIWCFLAVVLLAVVLAA